MKNVIIAGMANIGRAHLRTDLPARGLKHEKTEESNAKVFKGFTGELVDMLSRHHEQRKRVETDPDWSEAGKTKKLKEIDGQFQPQLNDFRRRIGNIKEMLRQDLAQYQPKPYAGTGNPILDELRAQEIRRHLIALEPNQRIDFAMNPDNDPMVVWAIKNSPIPIPDLDSDLVARVEAYQMEKLNPEGTLLSQDHELLLETLEYNLSEVEKVFAVPNTEPTILGQS